MQFEAFMGVSTGDNNQPKGMHMKNEPLPTNNEEWGFWGTSVSNGYDGNAFNVLGLCQCAARKAHVPAEDIKAFMEEASSGDYDHLLATCQKWFDCY